MEGTGWEHLEDDNRGQERAMHNLPLRWGRGSSPLCGPLFLENQ